MGAMGKQKINLNAMQANLNRNIREHNKEKIISKITKKKRRTKRREEEAKKREGYTNLITGNQMGKWKKVWEI